MDTLADIARLVRECTDCPLHQGRTQAVPGEGPDAAELLFIGEGPGVQEDRQGRPFVGPAGAFLEELLQSIGMTRDQVYIANMVKCRPPNNRDPAPGEIAACAKYLERQIELIDPRLIVTLGRFSTGRFLPGQSISRVRGRLRTVNGRQIYPIMHPAAGLRRQEMKDAIVDDFEKLAGLLEVLRMDLELPPTPDPPLEMAPSLATDPPPATDPPAAANDSATDTDTDAAHSVREVEMDYTETAPAAPAAALDPASETATTFWGSPAPMPPPAAYATADFDDDRDPDGESDLPPAPSYDNPPPGQSKLF